MMLPSCPSCFYWRLLRTEDGALLRPLWLQLDAAQGGSPVWQSWKHSLIDIHKGSFDQGLLSVAGLFNREGVLTACVAETLSLDHGQLSEINFIVLPNWRRKGLGTACLRAGLALARSHGSSKARFECGVASRDAIATLTRFGLTPVGDASHATLWHGYVSLSLLPGCTLALKRIFIRFFRKQNL